MPGEPVMPEKFSATEKVYGRLKKKKQLERLLKHESTSVLWRLMRFDIMFPFCCSLQTLIGDHCPVVTPLS